MSEPVQEWKSLKLDASLPSSERQKQLQFTYQRNISMGRKPYQEIQIFSMGELNWIMNERNWSCVYPLPINKMRPDFSGIIIRNVNLSDMNFTEANLSKALIREVIFRGVQLVRVNFSEAEISYIDLTRADLDKADFRDTLLENADLSYVNLEKADFDGASFRNVKFTAAKLDQANLRGADLQGANLSGVSFKGADLSMANLYSADLRDSDFGGMLESSLGANLSKANLERVNFFGANLSRANLGGANLRGAKMNMETNLTNVIFDKETSLCDVIWNNAPLSRVDWSPANTLGDQSKIIRDLNKKDKALGFRNAARAYHGLGVALSSQGLSAQASHYRLREQQMERQAFRLESRYGAWGFSSLLELISGYGERPGRAFLTYIIVILSFAGAYFGLLHHWDITHVVDALVFSLTAFHGRGFFPGSTISPHDPQVILAAAEAVFGLFIELIFIATFSRRFLGG